MSKPDFGKILDPDLNPVRDAVHVPIIPVYALEFLLPGQPIVIMKQPDKFVACKAGTISKAVGVVDPFLNGVVVKGQLFYCFVKPEMVQKLWHEWPHKEIDNGKI